MRGGAERAPPRAPGGLSEQAAFLQQLGLPLGLGGLELGDTGMFPHAVNPILGI